MHQKALVEVKPRPVTNVPQIDSVTGPGDLVKKPVSRINALLSRQQMLQSRI